MARKEQTQEEASTEDSKTPATPSTQSGDVVEEIVTDTVDEVEGVNLYTINDTSVTRDDIVNNLENEEFIESVRSGETDVTITDDLNLSEVFSKAVEFPSENKLKSTINKMSEDYKKVLKAQMGVDAE